MKRVPCRELGWLLWCLLFLGCQDQPTAPPPPLTDGQQLLQEGDHAAAEPLLLQALREAEARGQSDSRLASALHDMGELYRVKGDLVAAEPYFWRALPVWAESVGATHPRMATSLSSLGLVYEAKKEYAKALSLVRQALKIREKAFGDDHPNILPSLEQYAGLLRRLNRVQEAEEIDARRSRISGTSMNEREASVAF